MRHHPNRRFVIAGGSAMAYASSAAWADGPSAVIRLSDIPALRGYTGDAPDAATVSLARSWNDGDGGGAFDLVSGGANAADDGGVLIVDGVGRRWRRRLGGALDVRWWGARDDGQATPATTLAFRAALDFARRSQIRNVSIALGKGHFVLWPQRPGENILDIDFGGVSFVGAGRASCILDCRVRGGQNPNSHWDIVNGRTWRGSLFCIKGGRSAAERLKGFRVAGVTCLGNTLRTGSWKWPADPTTGDGWDITHKCVYVKEDTYTDDIVVEDADLRGWRGEIIYAGGGGMNHNSVTIRRVNLYETNASALSVSGGMVATNIGIWRAYNGVENYPGPHLQRMRNFHISDCLGNGMAWGGAMPPLDNCIGETIADGVISDCKASALLFTRGISHLQLSNVKISDCATALRFEPQSAAHIHHLEVENIQATVTDQDMGTVIGFYIAPNARIDNVKVSGVTATITPKGRASGHSINRSIAYYGPIGPNVSVDNCAIESKTPPSGPKPTAVAPAITHLRWTQAG
jgi:hypothetical protein